MLDDCVFLSDVLWGHKKQSYLTTSPDVKWLILEQPQTWRASDDRRTSPYTQQVRSERFKVAPISDDRILVDYLWDIVDYNEWQQKVIPCKFNSSFPTLNDIVIGGFFRVVCRRIPKKQQVPELELSIMILLMSGSAWIIHRSAYSYLSIHLYPGLHIK